MDPGETDVFATGAAGAGGVGGAGGQEPTDFEAAAPRPRAEEDGGAGREVGDTGGGAGGQVGDAGGGAAGCDDGVPKPLESCTACTRQGAVRGLVEGSTCSFLGMPYAKPPVGDLRWAPPQPAEGWEGVREATAYGAACVQVPDVSFASSTSEDCLFLNVHAPVDAAAAPLPVMVFLHGGGFFGGSADIYGGQGLSAAGPVVVVTLNYRLGVFGFLAHPELDDERGAAPSGSDGIRDQQLALRWVQENVAAFGGDPENVTVFGESAGGTSTCIHMVSPGSRGLAQRFIAQSGVCTSAPERSLEPASQQDAYSLAGRLAADLCGGGTEVLPCLRDLPAEELAAWAPAEAADELVPVVWKPVVEGPGGVLPESPEALINAGEINPGEVIVGTNKNEYALFTPLVAPVVTVAELGALVEGKYGPAWVDEIMAMYAPNDFVDVRQAYITLMTDTTFRCPTRRFARATSARGTGVYLYSFEAGAAQHVDELVYVLGPDHFAGGFLAGFAGIFPAGLIDGVQDAWTRFATDGDPNGPLPQWPTYDAATDPHMILADPQSVSSGLRRDACDLWDRYLAAR